MTQGRDFTAHVQIRASVPLFWSQEMQSIVPKPKLYSTAASSNSMKTHNTTLYPVVMALALVLVMRWEFLCSISPLPPLSVSLFITSLPLVVCL
jgi:hypothetical protein